MSHAAYVFDAYGTLFDVHAAVRRHAGDVGPNYQIFSEIWRAKQLEYSWIRTLMGAHADFWTLTEQSLDYAFRRFPSADPALKSALLDAYWHLDCYPEVPSVLKGLKADGARITAERIRSNISQLSLHFAKQQIPVSVSIGVATLGHGENKDSLLDRADHALYQAKQNGRNQTVVADPLLASAAVSP